MIGIFICMWLFYGTTQRNGTPTLKFFSSPYPLRRFSDDTIKGTNNGELEYLRGLFFRIGDVIGDDINLKGV